jgi:hypothetical protein
MMISNGGLDLTLNILLVIMKHLEDNDMGGEILLITIIGGDRYTHTITSFKERTFQITIIGVEGLGEMSIGGGIERLESFMIQNISLQRVTLVGGMGFQTIRTYLPIIWTFRLLGFDTIRIFLVFGEGIELHLTG